LEAASYPRPSLKPHGLEREVMIVRIPQRTQNDCAICAVAMVMGSPYTYERVLKDSGNYSKISPDGRFLSWWESYLTDEGFESAYCHFNGLYKLQDYGGSAVGLLVMEIPHLKARHIVAVDELGVIDPANNAPHHVPIQHYLSKRISDGVVFSHKWLAVRSKMQSAVTAIWAYPSAPFGAGGLSCISAQRPARKSPARQSESLERG
ncbi:MAG: hypothetical protein ACREDL_02970, partial [Bradyrhizobium sp.]